MVRVFVVVLGLLLPLVAMALPAEPDCSNPRDAADSLLVWLAPDAHDPARAITCLDVPEGANATQRAIHLKQILDARGLYVPVPSMPVDPDYTDEAGRHRLQPLPDDAPWLVLERDDEGAWRYTEATVAAVPELYRDTFSSLSLWFQSSLPDVFYTTAFGLYLWQFAYAALLVGIAWLLAIVVRVVFLTWVRAGLRRFGVRLDETLFRGVRRPILLMVVAAVVMWGIPDLQLSVHLSRSLHVVVSVALGLGGILLASKIVDIVADAFNARAAGTASKLDDQLIPLARQVARVVVWVVGTLFVLQNAGVEVWSFLAGLGIGSLAFALAAQDSIENLFGAVNIFVDKPFQIGDWVIIGSVEGTVEEVGFRSIRVRTFYNSLVTIPNSQITSANVDNMGLRPRRRVKTTLGLAYNTPPDKVHAFVEGVRAILTNHPAVEQTFQVHFYKFGASSLDILVYYHLQVPDWTGELEARAANFLEILRLAQELGVSFAFPSTSVYLESTPDNPLAAHDPASAEQLGAIIDGFGPGGHLARPTGPRFPTTWSPFAPEPTGEVEDNMPG